MSLYVNYFTFAEVGVGEERVVALPHRFDGPDVVAAFIADILPMKKVVSLGKVNLQRHSTDSMPFFRSCRFTKFVNSTSERVLRMVGDR